MCFIHEQHLEPLAKGLHSTHLDQSPQAQVDMATDVASLCCALAQDPANAAMVANALPSLSRLLRYVQLYVNFGTY
jgi:hypothetical protein